MSSKFWHDSKVRVHENISYKNLKKYQTIIFNTFRDKKSLMAKEIVRELRSLLSGRRSVFSGSIEVPTEQVAYNIIYDALKAGDTVIWACLWGPPGSILNRFSSYGLPLEEEKERLWFIDATIVGENTPNPRIFRCQKMDYICISMHVTKLMKKASKPLVIIDNIGIMASMENIKLITRIIEYLNTIVCCSGGSLLTTLKESSLPGSMEAEVMALMDTVVRVKEHKIIAHADSRELEVLYRFSSDELILGDEGLENELEDLFTLTTREKELLELEVEEKAQLYRELVD